MDRNIAIELAKDAVINARDFCGNEKEAAIESLRESGFEPTDSLLSEVARESNLSWAAFQKQADVKPENQNTGIYFSHYGNFSHHGKSSSSKETFFQKENKYMKRPESQE